jgi:hypothetical protein
VSASSRSGGRFSNVIIARLCALFYLMSMLRRTTKQSSTIL